MALTTWSVEYHETMAATERARLNVERAHSIPGIVRALGECILWMPFHRVTRDLEKLVSLLQQMETYPSQILLEEDALKIPQSLRELFQKICVVIQQTKNLELHDGFILTRYIGKLEDLGRQISEFASRYEDAQNKLRSRVAAEDVQSYKDSFAAYGNCAPTPEQATDDDVKTGLLRF